MANVDLSDCKRLIAGEREFFYKEVNGVKNIIAEKVNQVYLFVYPKGSVLKVLEEDDTLRITIDE